jgi:serine/threonine-protein kinase HipA
MGTRGMGLLDLNHHNLASTKAFDIEIDNLISLSQKMLSKRGFETNLNEKDQNAMLDILKMEPPQAALAQKLLLLTMKKPDR